MTLNSMKTKRWIGLVAAALTVLLVLPLMYADNEKPQRVRPDRERLQQADDEAANSDARTRVRAVQGERAVRPGDHGFRGSGDDVRSRGRGPGGEPSMIAGLMVTDTNPDQIKDGQVAVTPYWHGPFDGPDTLNLFVVTLFDDSQLDGEFDLVTRFILPDGHLYEERVTPVDPQAEKGQEVSRPDLAPHPVEVRATAAAGAVARTAATPAHVQVPQDPSYVRTVLPVTGTWITKHGLYGTWTVQAIIRQDGKDIEMSETTFDVHR